MAVWALGKVPDRLAGRERPVSEVRLDCRAAGSQEIPGQSTYPEWMPQKCLSAYTDANTDAHTYTDTDT